VLQLLAEQGRGFRGYMARKPRGQACKNPPPGENFSKATACGPRYALPRPCMPTPSFLAPECTPRRGLIAHRCANACMQAAHSTCPNKRARARACTLPHPHVHACAHLQLRQRRHCSHQVVCVAADELVGVHVHALARARGAVLVDVIHRCTVLLQLRLHLLRVRPGVLAVGACMHARV